MNTLPAVLALSVKAPGTVLRTITSDAKEVPIFPVPELNVIEGLLMKLPAPVWIAPEPPATKDAEVVPVISFVPKSMVPLLNPLRLLVLMITAAEVRSPLNVMPAAVVPVGTLPPVLAILRVVVVVEFNTLTVFASMF